MRTLINFFLNIDAFDDILTVIWVISSIKRDCIHEYMGSHRSNPLACNSSAYSSAMNRRGMVLVIYFALACFSAVLKAEEVGSCETQCGDNCCPHENGVCCDGDSGCCRHGQTCLSNIDTCIGLNSTTQGNVTLHSEKTTPVAGVYCPNGSTSCESGCCPYVDGVCCNDGYCCPQGFKCSPTACVLEGARNKTLKKALAGKNPESNIMGHKLKDLGIQICPDKLHLCPGSTECCRKDNGEWDCCPKVSNLKGECCSQFFIWICCTDLVPKCHWWGCWWT